MTITTTIPTWTLAEKLQKARKTAGLNRADLAAKLGMAERTLVGWECGERKPHITLIERWAHLTGVDFDWLSEGVVRPKGFEPLTFWSGVFAGQTALDPSLRSTWVLAR